MSDIKVLIVDDQEIYRSALSDLLEVVGGYVVVGRAASGEEAVELAATTAADVVFMDLRLPGINGLEATAAIRLEPGAPEVIMISTDSEALDTEAVRGSGALDRLAKADLDPDWLEALRARLQTGLSDSGA